ncbi:MAG: hypothetical protein EXR35_07410 [Limnohabitans sp.]|nr:hypothetical protein [Limnohabitans sp.]
MRDLQSTGNDRRYQAGTRQDTHIFIPQSVDDLQILQQRMSAQTCSHGICLYLQQPAISVADWLAKESQSFQVSVGASTPKGFATGYYWIESWPLQTSDPQNPKPLIYRITAFSKGLYSGAFNTWQSLIPLNP